MSGRLSIQCSNCGAKLSVAGETKLGKKIRCPKCSEVFVAKGTVSPNAPGKAKRAKRPDDEFDFGSSELEDYNNPIALPQARRKNSTGRQTASTNSSTSKLPLILAAVTLLLAGVGGFWLFNRSNSNEGSTQLAQEQSPRSALEERTRSDYLAATASAGKADGKGAQPSSSNSGSSEASQSSSPAVATMGPESIGSAAPPQMTATTPPGQPTTEVHPVATQASAVADKKLGETEEFEATIGANPEAGISRVSGRSRWNSMMSVDELGQNQDVIVLLIDLEGDVLNRTIAVGKAKFSKLNVSPGVSLKPFKGFPGDPYNSENYIPFDSNRAGIWGEPTGILRTGLRFVAPANPSTILAEVEGTIMLKVAKNAEEITIPDIRTAANKPLSQPALFAARAELFYKSQQTGSGVSEVFDFRIGKKAAVSPLIVTSSTFPIELRQDLNIDPNGFHFSTRHLLSLPQGPLKMTFKVYKDVEEISVPFRFENMPLPDIAKKGP